MNQVFENGWMRRVWGVLCLSVALSGCVTTEERPDGSTLVRFHGSEALGLKPVNAGNAGNTQAQIQNAPVAANTNTVPPAPMLSTTPLAGLFAKHPYDGTSKTYYPRVALTIVDWTRNDCWVARAKIWRSSGKSENVAPFSVCFNKQSFDSVLNSAAGMHIFMQQMALEHSGNVRTEGPKPPMLATLDRQPMNVDRSQTTYVPFLQQIIAETGWKGGAPTNFWIVGYNAQIAATPEANEVVDVQALKNLESALSCNPKKGLEQAMRTLKISPPRTSDEFTTTPQGLTVFGLPAAGVSMSPDGDEGFYQTRFASEATLAQVNRAASLTSGKSRGFKLPGGKFATLNAAVKNGAVVLDCTIN